jgi:hypothetical protein
MATRDEMQKQHEAQLTSAIDALRGRGAESDWALMRALVHKVVHLTNDYKLGEFCALATLFSEMTTHAHEVMHPTGGTQDHTQPIH